MLVVRTLIIGNSGSGKTTLAQAIADRERSLVFGLDRFHWADGDFAQQRDEQIARQMTAKAAATERWVMEGVYGWLAEEALPRAQRLIWLDLTWAECKAGLLARKAYQPADPEMLDWAEQYWGRQTSSSFAGHQKIYERFPGDRLRLDSREAINEFVAKL
jgi:adenylate kinase family enzyme